MNADALSYALAKQLQTAHSLETAYGTRMVRAEERIKAVGATKHASKHLGVAIGTPLLSVDRVAYTYGDRAVEWRRGLCLTSGYSYLNDLA